MIKYIGSKRALLTHILGTISGIAPRGATILDLFSGTARVGHGLKAAGYRVIANDHNAYAHTLAKCYVQADRERWADRAQRILADLMKLPSRPGYFTETFCVKSRFFQPKNGERVDAIREAIASMGAAPELEAILLVSLMEAADRVDSTAGLQMAYMKSWAARSFKDLELRLPALVLRPSAGPCRAVCGDAAKIAATIEADVAYLDPPYNQHSYLNNYHIWESLVRWDKPDVYGIACKRIDCKTRKSAFNSKPGIIPAMKETLAALKVKMLVVSFNNEGYIDRTAMESLLRDRGHLAVIELKHDRYVGAKIGIYNPQGQKVGRVGHLENTEYLYVVTEDRVSLPLSPSSRSMQPTLL